MTISTYTTLKTAVFDYSGRDDLSTKFSTFVQLAEQVIYHNEDQPLRVQDLLTKTTLTTVGGTNSLTLPVGYLSGLSVSISYGGIERELTNTSLAALRQRGEQGVPEKFAISDVIEFDYTPDGAYDINLTYYAQPPALDDTNNSNIILTKYPSIYFYGCLSQVSDMSGESEEAERYYNKMLREIRGAVRSNRKLRGAPGATMTVRGATP